jgi:hypothetical protein
LHRRWTLCGDAHPVIPREYLDAFAADHPELDVEHVSGTNHYTLVLGNSPGPPRVAAAIEAAIRDAERASPGQRP